MTDETARSPEYQAFWAKLAAGDYDSGSYLRLRKDGQPVYIEATYNPVRGPDGRVASVLKVATDITKARLQALANEETMRAISRVQAVIRFTTEGIVLDANDNFGAVMGYRREEVVGRHHRMFVDEAYAQSAEYRDFWRRLGQGEAIVDSFHRVGANGKPIWLQASYGPIRDLSGKVIEIVKFAYDITDLLQLGEGLSALAHGDLSQRLTTPFASTFDRLRVDFNTALATLEGAMSGAVQSARNVGAGADEIAAAVTDLSQRTESQAASLEESAAALAEVTKTVGHTSRHVGRVNEVVGAAGEDSRKAGAIVVNAVEAMGRIERSSNEIGAIIGVIDEIAFQTNLLALNAGVEAARAGDAGRGFAVVASEVRALAQRSTEAARQIKALVATSGSDVKNGVGLVRQTGDALNAIVAKVAEINSLVAQIVKGTEEQSLALDEVNSAVGEMDKATQQNAAMAEQSNAAVQAMRDQVAQLNETMRQFQISGAPGRSPGKTLAAPSTRGARRAA